MRLELKKINRTVEIDNSLAETLNQVGRLRENTAVAFLILRHGSKEALDAISDEELSADAEEAFVNELRMLSDLPAVIDFINNHSKELEYASKIGLAVEMKVDEQYIK